MQARREEEEMRVITDDLSSKHSGRKPLPPCVAATSSVTRLLNDQESGFHLAAEDAAPHHFCRAAAAVMGISDFFAS